MEAAAGEDREPVAEATRLTAGLGTGALTLSPGNLPFPHLVMPISDRPTLGPSGEAEAGRRRPALCRGVKLHSFPAAARGRGVLGIVPNGARPSGRAAGNRGRGGAMSGPSRFPQGDPPPLCCCV